MVVGLKQELYLGELDVAKVNIRVCTLESLILCHGLRKILKTEESEVPTKSNEATQCDNIDE